MSHEADAWVLYAGEPGDPIPAPLVREAITFAPIAEDEVLVAPLYGCLEGNHGHAVTRTPVDICRHRREPKVVLGNAGVVRVLEVGRDVTSVRPGQAAMMFPAGTVDEYGHMVSALGYDAPGQMGIMATRAKLRARQIIALPEPSRFSLAQWAAFSVRYVTAWSNWELAHAVFRLQAPEAACPSPHVWGWGGGTTLAELDLARRQGCRAVMLSGSDRNLATIERTGVAAVDRRRFGELSYDAERYERDVDYRRAYQASEADFIGEVTRRTGGEMVHIFVDYVGSPVVRATQKALARRGIVTTAGWKRGMEVTLMRARACIARHQHLHTHYARYEQAEEAMQYAERHGWMPEVEEVRRFDEVPALLADYLAARTDYFPCFSIAEDPAA